MGKIEGLFSGFFKNNVKVGMGVYVSSNNTEIYGNWLKDNITGGVIYNRNEKYIFIGRFCWVNCRGV